MKKIILLLVAACCSFGSVVMAQTAMERLKKEYPAVMEQYGRKLQDLSTHYIFVIDVSGTMDQYKEEVVIPGIKGFLETLPEGNYASIVAFGGNAAEMCTPLRINAENRKILVEKLNESYSQSARLNPRTTLLSVASSKVLDLVERDTTSDICIAVFFSDLCDEAARDWSHRDRVNALGDRALGVVATALTANNDAQKQRGIRRMENTFPGFSYSSNVKDVFGEKLEAFKYDIYIPMLRKIAVAELGKIHEGLNLSATLGYDKGLKLKASFNKNTPAFIRGLSVDTAYLTDQSASVSGVDFVSHASMPRYRGSCRLGQVKFADTRALMHRNQQVNVALRYRLTTSEAKSDKEPCFARDMEALGVADALCSEASLETKTGLVLGWNIWAVVTLGLVAILIAIWLIWLLFNIFIPGKIKSKTLICSESLNDATYQFNANGKVGFTAGDPDSCKADDWSIPDTKFVVQVKHRNGSPLNLIVKHKIMFLLDDKESEMRHTVKGKSFATRSANLLDGVVEVQSKGIRYEFSHIDNK